MAHTTNNGPKVNPHVRPVSPPKVNPDNPFVMPLVDIAISVAYSIFLVKPPVTFVRDTILGKLSWLLRYCADKSARGVHKVLGSAVNNRLTKRISHSASLYLDNKIWDVCVTAGEWAGSALVLPFTLAFYLVATAYALVVSLVAVTVVSAVSHFEYICLTYRNIRKALYEKMFLPAKNSAASCNNIASKAVYFLFNITWRYLIDVVFPIVAASVMYTLEKTLCLLYTPFLAPVYMLSSALGFNNRFNIYNCASDIGTVHGYMYDIVENKHKGGIYIPPFAHGYLLGEAVKGDPNSTDTIDTVCFLPTRQLDTVTVEHGMQHQHHHTA